MHLHCETDKQTNDNSMSSAGVDIRLRRQMPVSSKPPRLRLETRISSHQQQSRRQHQHDTNSLPVNFRNAVHETTGTGASASCHDTKKNCYVQSTDAGGNIKRTTNNGSRPLIHHQRQNLKNRFHLLKTLGEGTYGKVKLAVDKGTGENVAIKYIKKTKIEDGNDLMRIRREIKILSSLRHEHIVNIREVFEKKDKIVLVLDFAQGGELYEYLNKMGKLSESEARRIFRQIVSAVHYCHQNGIVHRDLKLENIILDDEGNVKIADFGLSNYYSHNSTLKTFCGSPLYASPEIVNGRPYHGPEVDVWSLGVILYTLVYGSMPFESNNLVSLKKQISDGDYSQPSKPSDAAGLIRHMLTVTPSRRATMEDALRHWWINFRHSHMPNDMPYSPDDEPPIMSYSLAASKSSLNSPLDPPTIIHHRNQSSISSDSDLELDFRPSRWSRRTISLDSTGNSVSSSVASSPAPTPDSHRHTVDENSNDSTASIASGLLNLPPDVLEILKGCSSKSLAALLSKDKMTDGFEIGAAQSTNPRPCQTSSATEKVESVEFEKATSSVFDSERMPKRGILKRKGKFSGSDSGCIMGDEMTVRPEDSAIPKSGHLPRRLPSFRDEANGIFASRHRASQFLDSTAYSIHNGNHSTAITHCSWSYFSTQSHRQDSHDQKSSVQTKNPQNHPGPAPIQTGDTHFHVEATSVDKTDSTSSLCKESIPPEQETSAKPECTEGNVRLTSGDLPYDNTLSKEISKVVHRPKSILKKTSGDEARNRLSISSIGSNSSADILDLSYDSVDGDHFVNHGADSSPDSEAKNGSDNGVAVDEGKEQRSLSLDEGLLNVQISENLTYASRHRSLSDAGGNLLDLSLSLQ